MSKYLHKGDVHFNNNGKTASPIPLMVTAGTQLRFDTSIKLSFIFKHFKVIFSKTDKLKKPTSTSKNLVYGIEMKNLDECTNDYISLAERPSSIHL